MYDNISRLSSRLLFFRHEFAKSEAINEFIESNSTENIIDKTPETEAGKLGNKYKLELRRDTNWRTSPRTPESNSPTAPMI